jgi:hypothetical protein
MTSHFIVKRCEFTNTLSLDEMASTPGIEIAL